MFSIMKVGGGGDAQLTHRSTKRNRGKARPFLVGGAYALACYTGISRQTKDVDFFLRAGDVDSALVAFQNAGYDTEKTFPHWLAKVHAKDNLVDLIYAA